MKYFSLNNNSSAVSFREAVINGIAPDKGLYFPESISPLPTSFWNGISNLSKLELALEAIHQFVGDEIPKEELESILEYTLDFPFPIINLDENISVLELFHGPTMAFKDVGSRFMAQCLGYFNQDSNKEITVLVATSGDTGGAVANGFHGVKGIKVVILYPSGKVSDIQEKQLTTLGDNVYALEVEGVFDDCQDMVKTAFIDKELTNHINLTSANSINVARWLPQMFYYIFAYKELGATHDKISFSVPSGNFGNICAGLVARKLGLPIDYFVASTNVNDIVPTYLKNGEYIPKPSVATISNAMDVGNPSNFIRIQNLFDNKFENLKEHFQSYSFNDQQTISAINELYTKYNYIADPHGAVAYLGSKTFLESHPNYHSVFLETAHPAKFLEIVEKTLNLQIELPSQLKSVLNMEKVATKIKDYSELKNFLLNRD